MKAALLHFSPTLLLLMLLQAAHGADVPHQIAGIELGGKIEEYPDFEYSNYLKEVVVFDLHGFRKGIISYSTCYSPGVIVRLRMKYANSSEAFFDTLKQRFTEKYGDPKLWKGDPFGIKHVWKWNFKDDTGKRISMVLQHNLQDDDETLGNQVKLYYPDVIEEEHLCYLKNRESLTDSGALSQNDERKKSGWQYLIPQ